MKNRSIEKPFLIFVIILSGLLGIFHFIRLSFGWDIYLDNWAIPELISGFKVVISVFIIYWASIILNQKNGKNEESNKEEEHEELEM